MTKTKIKREEECGACFEIEVPGETIQKAFEEVYGEITRVANIPGFREGKAPKELVKKHYTKDARDEVLKRLIPEGLRDALKEHNINPLGLPEISDVRFEGEVILSFKAKVDTRPKFKLKNYELIKIEKKPCAISDEDVEKTLKNLREINAKYVTVEARPAKMGDYIVSDMDCFIEDKPVHKKRENLWLYMDEESLIPDLTKKMIGMNKGEERDIEVKLPDNYPDKAVAGKTAKYHVAAKEIKERILPNVDDEFAKDVGRQSLEELKGGIRKELEAQGRANMEIDMENQLLNKLMDENVFAVPSSFVARQLDHMVEDAKKRLGEKGFKREELDKKDKEFKEKFKNDAARQVRLLFILNEIANIEKIESNDEDLKEYYRSISAQSGKTEDDVRNYYEKEGLVDSLKEKLREGKTIQFLLSKAEIIEK